MKKILALVLSLMLALSVSAMAETTTTSMTVSLSEIELNLGQAFIVNPTVSIAYGSEGESAWAQVSALIGEEKVFVGQVDLLNNEAYLSVEGANDVLKVLDADKMSEDLTNQTTSELISMLNGVFAQKINAENIDTQIMSLAATDGMTIEKLGELDYKANVVIDEASGMGASFRLTIELGTEKPFDLSGKNVVEVAADADAAPENDVLTTAQQNLSVLMADESIASLVTLFMGLAGSTANAA